MSRQDSEHHSEATICNFNQYTNHIFQQEYQANLPEYMNGVIVIEFMSSLCLCIFPLLKWNALIRMNSVSRVPLIFKKNVLVEHGV